jgi:hypothetical protein
MSESADKARLIAALIAARSAIEAVLLQVADEVSEAQPAAASAEKTAAKPASVSPGACEHPAEMRRQIKSMGSVEHWICDPLKGGCGYEHRR